MRLFGAGGDRNVPFANALTAAARVQQIGADVRAVNLEDPLNHSSAVVPALIAAKEWFDGFRQRRPATAGAAGSRR